MGTFRDATIPLRGWHFRGRSAAPLGLFELAVCSLTFFDCPAYGKLLMNSDLNPDNHDKKNRDLNHHNREGESDEKDNLDKEKEDNDSGKKLNKIIADLSQTDQSLKAFFAENRGDLQNELAKGSGGNQNWEDVNGQNDQNANDLDGFEEDMNAVMGGFYQDKKFYQDKEFDAKNINAKNNEGKYGSSYNQDSDNDALHEEIKQEEKRNEFVFNVSKNYEAQMSQTNHDDAHRPKHPQLQVVTRGKKKNSNSKQLQESEIQKDNNNNLMNDEESFNMQFEQKMSLADKPSSIKINSSVNSGSKYSVNSSQKAPDPQNLNHYSIRKATEQSSIRKGTEQSSEFDMEIHNDQELEFEKMQRRHELDRNGIGAINHMNQPIRESVAINHMNQLLQGKLMGSASKLS
jgi:hypothetical protein